MLHAEFGEGKSWMFLGGNGCYATPQVVLLACTER